MRILITVEGGVIQSIEADGIVGIYIADLDGFNVGEKLELRLFPAQELSIEEFSTQLRTIRERFLKENEEQEKLANE